MTLSDLSIKNPVFAWMLMIGLIVFGWIGFRGMGVSQLPDVDFPVLSVSVTWEGAAPEVMETEIADTLESALISIQGLREISSTSRQGSASINLEFDLTKDIDFALQEVQAKVAEAQRLLPREMEPPVIRKSNPEDQPIMWLSLSGDKPTRYIMQYTRDNLKDRFTTIPGVGEVFLGGYVEPNLRVWVDASKLRNLQITVDDVIAAIGAQHAEVPAGRIETGKQELNVRVLGEAVSVEEFKRIIIPARGGAPVWKTIRLGDVAEVEDGLADIRRISRAQGTSAVGLGIRKQRGANAVAVAKAVKARMEEVKKDLPEGLELAVNFDTTRFIEESTHELLTTLTLAAVLTSIVCWVFLGSFSSAFNVIMAIPTSIVGAFLILYFCGFTLNTFTLLGLSLCIGIVVDDAIMVLENIVRHRELGLSKVKAALVGAREISFAAMAATIAILAIFVPVIFMKGIIGKFFFQFGVTLSVAVSLSLLEALTLAPMRCAQFLEVGHSTAMGRVMDKWMGALTRVYSRALAFCLARRWTTCLVSGLLFLGSMAVIPLLQKEFTPSQDQSRFLVRLQTPLGSSIETTTEAYLKAEAIALARPEVERIFGAIGGFGGGEVNVAQMFFTLKDKKDRPVSPPYKKRPTQADVMNLVRDEFKKVPGIQRVAVQDLSQQGFSSQRGYPVELSVRGPEWDKLGVLAEDLAAKMEASGMMIDADTDYRLGMPEVRVAPNRDRAAQRGVTVGSIANTINAMIGGVRAGRYTQGGKRYDIRVRVVAEDRRRPDDINSIYVRNNRGEVLPLSEVVAITEKPSLLSINRKNRERAIGVFANVAKGASQGEALAKAQAIAKDILPEGYRVVLSGSAQTYAESFGSLMTALVLGIFVAYMVLGAQFNSFVHPFTVLLALPFSLTGAFLALWLTGITLNIYSMIGLLLLMGLAKKNSILLVEFTNERRKHMGVREALMEACPIRLRPILMTSVSTIAGAIPAALAFGAGAETVRPMAVVVIGGMLVSTVLTMFVVPCAYSLLSKIESEKHEKDLQEALRELGELPAQTPAAH